MTLHIAKNLIVVNVQHPVIQHVPVGGRVFDITPPRASNLRMSPRANSPPVVPQPVRHVVPTSVIPAAARTSPVRDLVVDVPSLGENLFGKQVFVSEIVLVSHSLGQIESLCDEVAWIDHGKVQSVGKASTTVGSYISRVNEQESLHKPRLIADRDLAGGARSDLHITSLRIVDAEGNPIDHAETGETFFIRLGLTAPERFLGPNVRFGFQHESGALVAMVGNHRSGIDLGWLEGEHTVEMGLSGNPLLPGRYIVHVDVFDHSGSRLVDSWSDAVEFVIRSQRGEIGQGFVDLQATYRMVP